MPLVTFIMTELGYVLCSRSVPGCFNHAEVTNIIKSEPAEKFDNNINNKFPMNKMG